MPLNPNGFDPVQEAPQAADPDEADYGDVSTDTGFEPEQPNEDQQRLEQSLYLVRDESPDEHAKAMQLSRKTGIPVDTVKRDPKGAELDLFQKQVAGAAENSPAVAKWAADLDNAATAKDEFDKLGYIVSWMKQATMGLKLGQANTRQAILANERADDTERLGKLSPKNAAELEQIKKERMPLDQLDENVRGNFHPLYQTAQQLPNMFAGFARYKGAQGFEAAARAFFESAGEYLLGEGQSETDPLQATAKAASVGTGIEAGPAVKSAPVSVIPGMWMSAYEIERGGAFDDYINQPGVDPVKAAKVSKTVGAINATLETAGEVVLGKFVLGPVGKASSGALTKAAQFLGSKIPGAEKIIGRIAANPKVFEKMTLSQAVKAAGKEMLEAGITEVSTEVAQELSSNIGGLVASSKELNSKNLTEAAKDATKVAYPTAQGLLLPFAFGGARHVYEHAKEMAQAEADKAAVESLSESVYKTKTFARDKQTAASFVDAAAKNTRFEVVHLDPQGAETYFQSRNLNTAEALAELGVTPQQFETAKESGTLISIPIKKWAEKVVGTEHVAGLAEHVTLDENGKTFAQAKEQESLLGDAADQVVKDAKVESDKSARVNESRAKVEKLILGQLEQVQPDHADKKAWFAEAKANAQVFASIAAAQAEKEGVPVEQVLASMPTKLDVGNGQIVDLTSMQQSGEPMTDAERIQQSEEQFFQTSRTTPTGFKLQSVDENFTPVRRSKDIAIEESSLPHVQRMTEAVKARYGDSVTEAQWQKIEAKAKKTGSPYVNDTALSFPFPNYDAKATGVIGDPTKYANTKNAYKAEQIHWFDMKYGAAKALIEKHKAEGKPLTITTAVDLISHDDYIAALPKDAKVQLVLAEPLDIPRGVDNWNEWSDTRRKLGIEGLPSTKRMLIAYDKLRQDGVNVRVFIPDPENKRIKELDPVTLKRLIDENDAHYKPKSEDETVYQTRKPILPELGIPHDYFVNPEGKGDVKLPALRPDILSALKTEDKPVVVKENIAKKNRHNHPEIGIGEDAQILRETLYTPDYVLQTRPKEKPNYYAFVKQDGGNSVTIIEVNANKAQHEVVGWRRIDKKRFDKMMKETEREGGQFLITKGLSPQGAADLSALTPGKNTVSNGEEFNQTRRADFKTSSDLRAYVAEKASKQAVFVVPAGDLDGKAASYDPVSRHLLIADNVTHKAQVDSILAQAKAQKPAEIKGKVAADANGKQVKVDAAKAARAMARELVNLRKLLDCVGA